MADVDKKTRLAAARKKLKQLQKSNNSIPSKTASTNKNGPITRSESPAAIKDTTEVNDEDLITKTETVSNPMEIMPTQINHTNVIDDAITQHKTTITDTPEMLTNGDVDSTNHDTENLKENYKLLKLQNEELKHQSSKLQLNLELERKNFEERLSKDVSTLKDQLKTHLESVAILLTEKSELQSTCNQIQKISETRQSEIEELAGRLKASRQRVSDLERSNISTNSTNQKLEKQNKEFSKELDKLKMEVYKNNKSREEMQQHNLELQGKLQQKIQELQKSEDAMIELKGKVEMSEVYIEQLKNGQERPDSNVSKQIEMILTEKTQLQTQLQMKEDSLKLMTRERDSMASQYNEYVQQLSRQNSDLNKQIELLSREKDEMSLKVDEVQNELHLLKDKQEETTSEQLQVHEEKSRLLGDVEDLMAQLMTASNSLQRQKGDNAHLSKLLEEKDQEIISLELKVERMSGSKVDNEKLLDEMNNDKTALSRAVSQNKKLKDQFLELQDKFVKMSEKNMELMTKLQAEEHKGKGGLQRLRLQEDEIKALKNDLDSKAKYYTELENSLTELKATVSSSTSPLTTSSSSEQEKMAELFRLKVPLIENLQKELSSAQDTVNALTNQNSELKEKLLLIEEQPPTETVQSSDKATLDIINRIELEKANLAEQLKESNKVQDLLKNKIDTIQHNIAQQAPAVINGDVVNKTSFEALQHAMKLLEEKYSKVMRDKAEMVDANERLEHIVMQLQGETDTIGEYVSLYQHQRKQMRLRAVEKDSMIKQLQLERKELQSKMQKLKPLVFKLMKEGGAPNDSITFHLNDSTLNRESFEVDAYDEGNKENEPQDKEGKWPNYSDSSEDEVEEEKGDEAKIKQTSLVSSPPQTRPHIPPDNTVTQIMNILSEISACSTASSENFKIVSFCKRCTGDIILV